MKIKTNKLVWTFLLLASGFLGCKQLNQENNSSAVGGSSSNSLSDLLVIINSGSSQTSSTNVTLTLYASNATQMYITNTAGCTSGGSWETFASSKSWSLSVTNSVGTVYVKYKNSAAESSCVSDSISYLASGGWIKMNLSGAPPPRAYHSATWTGSTLLVFGGYIGNIATNTGGAFNPNTNSWTSISESNIKRHQHGAIWTGSKMIVWGGMTTGNSNSVVNSGEAYNPDSDTWASLSSAGAPVARRLHSTIWTGSKMIVWGGLNSSQNTLNSGGVYDPSTDSWTTISTINAPDARYSHSAVWSGSKMIVWGGRNLENNSYLQTGGIYDPETDSWTQTTTVGSPDGRMSHSGFWTGSKMLVWGGTGSSGGLASGGLYEPTSDSWETITNSPAFIGTYQTPSQHSVWTGTELLTWGGYAASGVITGRGAKFNLSANTWTLLPRGEELALRTGHVVTWTGTSLIVWGGNQDSNNQPLDDGAVYTP